MVINFRVNDELNDRIEDFLRNVKASLPEGQKSTTKSAVIRQLLESALGTPQLQAATVETLMIVVGIQKQLVYDLTQLMQSRARELLVEQIGEEPVVD